MLPPQEKPREQPKEDGVRELTPDEIKSVEHIFKAAGYGLPDPAVSSFVGAVRDGKVLGFIVLQAKLHCEPMWIEQGHSDLFQPIVDKAEQVVLSRCGPVWAYLFAPAGKVARLAETQGFQLEPFVVMSKLIAPEMPSRPATIDFDVQPAVKEEVVQ